MDQVLHDLSTAFSSMILRTRYRSILTLAAVVAKHILKVNFVYFCFALPILQRRNVSNLQNVYVRKIAFRGFLARKKLKRNRINSWCVKWNKFMGVYQLTGCGKRWAMTFTHSEMSMEVIKRSQCLVETIFVYEWVNPRQAPSQKHKKHTQASSHVVKIIKKREIIDACVVWQ